MIRTFTTTKIIKGIIHTIDTYDGDVTKIKTIRNLFKNMSLPDKVKFIEDIIDEQTHFIIRCMKDRENVVVPILGSFKIKKNRMLLLELADTLAQEKGFDNLKSADKYTKKVIRKGLSEEPFSLDDIEAEIIRQRRIDMFRNIKRNK